MEAGSSTASAPGSPRGRVTAASRDSGPFISDKHNSSAYLSARACVHPYLSPRATATDRDLKYVMCDSPTVLRSLWVCVCAPGSHRMQQQPRFPSCATATSHDSSSLLCGSHGRFSFPPSLYVSVCVPPRLRGRLVCPASRLVGCWGCALSPPVEVM